MALHNKYRLLDGENVADYADSAYVRSYVMYKIMFDAMAEVAASGLEMTRANVRDALESGYDSRGITAPIVFSASDHRPTMGAHIYTLDANGRFDYVTQMTLERRPEWLGW